MSTPQDRLRDTFLQGTTADPNKEQDQQTLSIEPDQMVSRRDSFFTPAQPPTFGDNVPKPGYGGKIVTSTLSNVLDFISRPQYASAKFFDGLASNSKGIFELVADSFNELVAPSDRMGFADVIKKQAPEFAKNYPKSTAVLGFLGDVALDPTTYLGVGLAGDGIKVGGKLLTKVGEEALLKAEGTIGGRALISAVDKGLFKDVQTAAEKGIQASVIDVAPNDIRKELLGLKKNYSDQLAELGFDVKANPKQARDLAKSELGVMEMPTDFTSIVRRNLSFEEVRERAEQRIMRLAEVDPTIAKQLFQDFKPGLTLGIPFTKVEAKILPLFGYDKIKDSIEFVGKLNDIVINKQIPLVSQAAKAMRAIGDTGKFIKDTFQGLFVRPDDQPFKEAITSIENGFAYATDQTMRETKKMFNGMDVARRDRMTMILRDIDDSTRKIEFMENRTVTQTEADDIFQKAMGNTNLTPEERSIVANLKQQYANVAQIEMESNLLKTELKNYLPRYYDALENPSDLQAVVKARYGLSTTLSSSQQRKFITLQEAEATGLVPEMDAAAIYATRVLTSRRAMVKKQFFDNLSGVFGMDIRNQNDLAKLGSLPNGKRYLDDIKLLGESVYPTGFNNSTKAFLQAADTLTGFFKRSATIVKPSFGVRQAASNTVQMMLDLGLSGAKTFDPRAFSDSAMLLFEHFTGKPTGELPAFITNIFNNHLDKGADAVLAGRVAMERMLGSEVVDGMTKGFQLTDAFGRVMSGEDLVRGMRENNVIRGADSIGDTFRNSIRQQLAYDPRNKLDLAKELGSFWKFASITEDYARATSFMQYVRQGYSFKDAANGVNKVLFDYTNGLTSFERTFVRRIVPFYSFQRFAIPYVLGKMVESPGSVNATTKVLNLMEKLMVSDDQSLTPAERDTFGKSYLIEQPRVYSGFDKDGKAKFNILNNLSPIDALSLFVHDPQTGKLDLQKTVEKSILASLTPFIKIPLEVALNKNFFTDKPITDAQNLGDLHENISRVIPQSVKDMIGWEDRTNIRTGQTSTYINPYLGYSVMSFIPALKQYLKPFDDSKSKMDAAMELITGVSPQAVDLKELREWQDIANVGKVKDMVSQIRKAKIKGSENEYERNLRDYQEFIQTIKEGSAIKQSSDIRGLGISGRREEAQQQQQPEGR